MAQALDAFGVRPRPRLDAVRKIAVMQAAALGDLVVAMPALDAVKAAYPEAELVLLGRDWHRALLTGRPGPVDRVIVLPDTSPLTAPTAPGASEALRGFLASMRAERFDLALQLQDDGAHSNPLISQLGARLTAGMCGPGSAPLDLWIHHARWQPEVLRLLEAVALVGVAPAALQGEFRVIPADLAEADGALPPHDGPLVAIHAGARDPRRRWPSDRFAEVADSLVESGAIVVLTGDRGDRDLVARVTASMRKPAVNLAGALSLGGLAGLLSRCALAVGNDSGPLHLARAVGTATVTIYWIGYLLNMGPVGRGRHRTPVSWTLECPVCGVHAITGRCEHRSSYVASVSTRQVLTEALDLLATEPPD